MSSTAETSERLNFEIPEDLKMLKRTIREYAEERLQPLADFTEEHDDIPEGVLAEMAEMGMFGIPFAEEYGGMGARELGYCLAMEEMGRAPSCFSNIIGAHTGIGAMSLYLDGSEELKKKYMPDLCAGKKIACFGLTEPGSGSDAAAMSTTAVRDGDFYALNGTKLYITNGDIAHQGVIYAMTDKSLGPKGGITAFWVDLDESGVKRGPNDKKMGLRGSHTCELVMDNARVPAANVIGQVGLGFVTAMKALDVGRLSLAAGAVGAAEYVIQKGIEHAKSRYQFKQPIANFQAIQFLLAESQTEMHAGRLMVYHAAQKCDDGKRFSMEAAMAKYYCSEMAIRVVDRVLQIYGGMGFMKDSGIERAYRDARILAIYEGTNQIQRLIIADHMLKG